MNTDRYPLGVVQFNPSLPGGFIVYFMDGRSHVEIKNFVLQKREKTLFVSDPYIGLILTSGVATNDCSHHNLSDSCSS